LKTEFKLEESNLEDGATSLRGIKQYNSMEEIYLSFKERYPKDLKKDIKERIENFEQVLKSF